MSKLIVIEGVDSSGKATQTELLHKNLCQKHSNVRKVSFPNYDSPSSAIVKMYLNGSFGDDAGSVSPYTASSFFAVDRYASVNGEWKDIFGGDGIVIADRYTTSNMVHQAAKIENSADKDAFLDWLYDFEYNKLALPKPDLVIFLDMPVEYACELMKNRKNKIDGGDVKDIHESDAEYLTKSYNNAVAVAEKYGWHRIFCAADGKVRTIEDISREILDKVNSVL
ncbi:MAG: thymidylate kinase [Ruminococcaceae bacterium]|nr:thymidylate kinase [Oscillospiraceae bacterium]